MTKTRTTPLLLALACFSLSPVKAATLSVDYDLSGGALFVTASGQATAWVSYYVGALENTIAISGTASGATSWNFGGPIEVDVEDASSVSTTPALAATRRAGTIVINFPIFNLGGLIDINVDASLLSNDSNMVLTSESGTKVNDTDWIIDQEYDLTTGGKLVALGTSEVLAFPGIPATLDLSSDTTNSMAILTIDPGTLSAGFFNGEFNPGCQVTGVLGNCLAGISSIVYDLSDVSLVPTSSDATGTGATLLPIPVPASFWLLLGGLASLTRFARRR